MIKATAILTTRPRLSPVNLDLSNQWEIFEEGNTVPLVSYLNQDFAIELVKRWNKYTYEHEAKRKYYEPANE